MNPYQEQLIENYKSPYNFGKPSWIPTNIGESQNLSCGDRITAFLKVKDNDTIDEIGFHGEGCSVCIGTASLLTQEFENKKVEKIKKMTLEEVIDLIGIELTTSRRKCAAIGLDAFKNSLRPKQASSN